MIDRTKPPKIHPFDNVHLDVPKAQRLSNGTPIHVIDRATDEVNHLSVFVRGGIMDEDRVMQAMLTSATLIEGCTKYNSSQIAQMFDNLGAWKTTQVYDDWSEISLWSLNEHYCQLLDVLVNCLVSPLFSDDDFSLLQRRYASTYATQQKRGKYKASLALRSMLYGETNPQSFDITPTDILSLTTHDACNFYKKYYRTNAFRVVLSGRVTDEMLKATDECLGQINIKGEVPPCYDWSHFTFLQNGKTTVIHNPDAVQSSVAMAIPAIRRGHPDYIKLRVLVTLLGGYFGSRLMSNIREEKGYTYGISAMLAGRADSGYIGISSECDTVFTEPLIAEVKKEINRLREELVTDEELNIVKQNMITDLVKTLDTPFSIAGYVSSMITYGVYPEYFNEQAEVIMSITPADLKIMAERYLDIDRLLIAIVSP